MRLPRLCLALAGLVVLAILTACDDSPAGPDGIGIGELQISGDIEQTLEIKEEYTSGFYGDDWTLGIIPASDSSLEDWAWVNWICAGGPATGTYEVIEDDDSSGPPPTGTCIGLLAHDPGGDGSERVFWSLSGEFEVTHLDADNRMTVYLDMEVRERNSSERDWHPGNARARVKAGFHVTVREESSVASPLADNWGS